MRFLLLFLCASCCSLLADEIGLIRVGQDWRIFQGVAEPSPAAPPASDWRSLSFNDSGWPIAPGGFSTPVAYPERTILTNYGNLYSTVYFRKSFALDPANNVAQLVLRIDYDDGFIAYLNGAEVARRGVSGFPDQPVPVSATALPHPRGVTEEILLTNGPAFLRPGTNLLAIQLLGSGGFDYTATVVAELLANLTRGPYIQNTSTTSVQVIWKTLTPAASAIEFGTNQSAPARIALEPGQTNHVATLTNLLPDTTYFYRPELSFSNGTTGLTNSVLLDWRSFHTFKTSGPISFNVVGDTGWMGAGQFNIATQMANTPADLTMHVGDLAYFAFSRFVADLRFLSVYTSEMRRRPWFLALGNHEMYLDQTTALDTFYLPTNNLTGTEHYYSFDHGDVHFTVLWTDVFMGADYRPGSPQFEWLEADLASTSKPWKLVFFHHVWRSSSIHDVDDYDVDSTLDSLELDAGPVQLARKYGVQLIFNGHDHGYQRLMPGNGPVSFVTGGGGALLYPFYKLHPDMVQFYSRYNFLHVEVDPTGLKVAAIADDGSIFDSLTIARTWPERKIYPATWNTPFIARGPADDLDGNVQGERFTFAGAPVIPHLGRFTSTGRLFVNNDEENLYLGFDQVMLGPGEELYVFLEAPGLPGVPSMTNIGNGLIDPDGEGADGLDFLSNLAFTNFSPAIGIILGDEYGDRPDKSFLRAGQVMRTGQGAFYLTNGLPAVVGQQLSQFNHSPQDFAVSYEQNADFIQLSLPLDALALAPGSLVKIGAIVALTNINTDFSAQSREIDSGGLASALFQSNSVSYLEPLQFQLSTNGLAALPLRLSINLLVGDRLKLTWKSFPGRRYQLHSSDSLAHPFSPVATPAFPVTATAWTHSSILEFDSISSAERYFRIEELPQ